MSLNELSARVGITNVNMSNIKTNKVSAIRFSTLNGICRVLECQPGDILMYVADEEELPEAEASPSSKPEYKPAKKGSKNPST